jgi:hypothetical protein
MAAWDQALRMRRLAFFVCFLSSGLAYGHIGSPDIYLDGKAGPYQLFVTIRPPAVIPGVAELEIRASDPGIRELRAVPMPMQGAGAKFAPVAEKLAVSKSDPQLYTASLWLMQPGSWQVRISAKGDQGEGKISIPVPSAARLTKRMQFGMGAMLAVLGLFLIAAVVAMVGASIRESRLNPGVVPTKEQVRKGHVGMSVALVVTLAAVWFGNNWWNSAARSYGEQVYKPLHMAAQLDGEDVLRLRLADPGWLNGREWHTVFTRSVDDFIPDHGHLMHLYMIREPGLDVIYHLHPEPKDPEVFRLQLPAMPSGTYNLYADVVHANGFPETLVSSIKLGHSTTGRELAGDDASGTAKPWQETSARSTEFRLPDGYRMLWLPIQGELTAKKPALFRFRLEKSDGAVPPDMAFYMGMLGHAAFVKTDGAAFAHVHPTGSVSMAAFMLAQEQNSQMKSMDGMNMPTEGTATLPNEVTIPYGFPSAGRYRIIVQMKHGQTVETGIFDATVT